jgi:hypothetical protein
VQGCRTMQRAASHISIENVETSKDTYFLNMLQRQCCRDDEESVTGKLVASWSYYWPHNLCFSVPVCWYCTHVCSFAVTSPRRVEPAMPYREESVTAGLGLTLSGRPGTSCLCQYRDMPLLRAAIQAVGCLFTAFAGERTGFAQFKSSLKWLRDAERRSREPATTSGLFITNSPGDATPTNGLNNRHIRVTSYSSSPRPLF